MYSFVSHFIALYSTKRSMTCVDENVTESDLSNLTLSMGKSDRKSELQTCRVGPAQRSQILVLTKRSMASGDENGCLEVQNIICQR